MGSFRSNNVFEAATFSHWWKTKQSNLVEMQKNYEKLHFTTAKMFQMAISWGGSKGHDIRFPFKLFQNILQVSIGIRVSVSASIPISEISQNMYNFSKFRRQNKPISVLRLLKEPSGYLNDFNIYRFCRENAIHEGQTILHQ